MLKSRELYPKTRKKFYIVDFAQIVPNVDIIIVDSSYLNYRKHIIKNLIISKYCWIDMVAITLPSVEVGEYTIVASGSIVTKSFKEGYYMVGCRPGFELGR